MGKSSSSRETHRHRARLHARPGSAHQGNEFPLTPGGAPSPPVDRESDGIKTVSVPMGYSPAAMTALYMEDNAERLRTIMGNAL